MQRRHCSVCFGSSSVGGSSIYTCSLLAGVAAPSVEWRSLARRAAACSSESVGMGVWEKWESGRLWAGDGRHVEGVRGVWATHSIDLRSEVTRHATSSLACSSLGVRASGGTVARNVVSVSGRLQACVQGPLSGMAGAVQAKKTVEDRLRNPGGSQGLAGSPIGRAAGVPLQAAAAADSAIRERAKEGVWESGCFASAAGRDLPILWRIWSTNAAAWHAVASQGQWEVLWDIFFRSGCRASSSRGFETQAQEAKEGDGADTQENA